MHKSPIWQYVQIVSIPEPAVVLVAISPLKNFVVTCTKPMKDASGQPGNNLKVCLKSNEAESVSLPRTHYRQGDAQPPSRDERS
jgi:hypothetical protein